MTEPHDGTAHAHGPDHFRLTCSCGWELDPAPKNYDRWVDLLEAHRAEARGVVDCEVCHYRRGACRMFAGPPDETCPFDARGGVA